MGFVFTSPVVVSFGGEPFFLDRDRSSFRDQTKAEVIPLDGGEVSEAEIVSACETVQFDFDTMTSKPCVVLVDNGQKLKAGKLLSAYVIEREGTSSVLAVIHRSEKCPTFWTKFGSKVVLREHKKLKTWDSNNEVVEWIQSEAKKMGLLLDSRIAMAMFQVVGDDLYRLFSELRKLQLLAGSGVPITTEHLQLVMTPATAIKSWDVVEAIFLGDYKRALNSISMLFQFSSEDPSLLILGALTKGVERLFVARSMLDKGAKEEEVASRLDMHPYRFRKSILPQVERQTLPGLVKAMQILSKLDVDLKTSHQRTLLELAILKLST